MNLSEIPNSIQAACAHIARPMLMRMGVRFEMSDVYRELGVDHVSTLQQARSIFQKLFLKSDAKDQNKKLLEKLNEKSFLSDIYHYQILCPDCWNKIERNKMTDEFKELILLKKDEYELSWSDVSRLLSISEDTLKKFKGQSLKDSDGDKDDGNPGPPSLPDPILEKLAEFFKGRGKKASVKGFCEKNPDVLLEMNMSYRVFSKLLLRLGFVSPTGIFLNNTGLDRIKRFSPDIIWGTDGKNMNIVINGELFRWVWQCLIDYKTTILVGGIIGEAETTDNLLKAIGESKARTGVSPMAIVMDNRLSENLPAIREYLDALGIEIVKTFPGNSKSNGIIENNFKVFESWVHGKGGKIMINADGPKELSRSLAELLTEVFTQLRNCAPRKSFGGKSASDIAKNSSPLSAPEMSLIREEIKALVNRFKNDLAQPIMTVAKELALTQALDILKPPSPDIFLKRLAPSYVTGDLILQALAIYETQKKKHPEKQFDHTYFGGILRNLIDQENLRLLHLNLEATYQVFWKNMDSIITTKDLKEDPIKNCERLTDEFLSAKIPAQGTLVLMYLKNMFMLIAGQSQESLLKIHQHLVAKIQKSKFVAYEKRELLLRKIYEMQSFARLMNESTKNILQNTTQVFSATPDPLITI